ncbi:MAG: hypothetical protein A2075_15685 [Geobacteraceae bacterium GWC2_58_44]|nr:MAG: hypothetical protein A2075_15685 [Geobacteraceae bacterium GWC2_58_44]
MASSHYHLYRCFKNRGVDAVLLTFNEREAVRTETAGTESEIRRFGATQAELRFLALLTTVYLKAKGSRLPAYQLFDIVASAPGVLRLNRELRRLKPDLIIIPDHGGPGLVLEKGRARLTLVTHHNPARFLDEELLGDFCKLDVREAVALEQRLLRKVDAVIAPSRYMESVFRDTYCFDGAVAAIPNPIDLTLVDRVAGRDLRGELGLPADAPLVYIPSAGSRLKGERFVAGIISTLAANSSGRIGFYLSGNRSPLLEEELRGVPPNVRIYAPGHLDYCDNLALVKACSFGISPTLIESFGMAILEAGLCGLPMVVFRVGGTGEIISDGENGFCVPREDAQALAAAANRLLSPDYCRDMGQRAYAFSRRHFDPDAIVDRYLAFCGID